MYTSIRKYRTRPEQMDELLQRVDESFAPTIESMPGFVAYEAIDCGNGLLYTITTCHDRDATEHSLELATEFVDEELADFEVERLEHAIGEVGVSRAVAEMLDPTHA
jgi:hypothetical protein